MDDLLNIIDKDFFIDMNLINRYNRWYVINKKNNNLSHFPICIDLFIKKINKINLFNNVCDYYNDDYMYVIGNILDHNDNYIHVIISKIDYVYSNNIFFYNYWYDYFMYITNIDELYNMLLSDIDEFAYYYNIIDDILYVYYRNILIYKFIFIVDKYRINIIKYLKNIKNGLVNIGE